MTFSKEFLAGREIHLAAKLIKTMEALKRENLLPAAGKYKTEILIPQIIAARKRIINKTYGCCLGCSDKIPEQRLLKHPHVSRCVPCQSEQESNKNSQRSDE